MRHAKSKFSGKYEVMVTFPQHPERAAENQARDSRRKEIILLRPRITAASEKRDSKLLGQG